MYPLDVPFKDSKYTKAYFKIIQNAVNSDRKYRTRNNPRYVYYEAHHILPKSIYPEYKNFVNYPWNKVLLTAKEHFICHLLLTKMCKDQRHDGSMKQAFYMMSSYQHKIKTSRLYSNMRKILSDNLSAKLKGVPKSNEQMQKMVETKRRNGTLKHTEEAKARMSAAQKGKIITPEDRLKKSIALTGLKKSKTHCENLSKGLKGRVPWNKGLTRAMQENYISASAN